VEGKERDRGREGEGRRGEGKERKGVGKRREREGDERGWKGRGGRKESRNTFSINSCLRPCIRHTHTLKYRTTSKQHEIKQPTMFIYILRLYVILY